MCLILKYYHIKNHPTVVESLYFCPNFSLLCVFYVSYLTQNSLFFNCVVGWFLWAVSQLHVWRLCFSIVNGQPLKSLRGWKQFVGFGLRILQTWSPSLWPLRFFTFSLHFLLTFTLCFKFKNLYLFELRVREKERRETEWERGVKEKSERGIKNWRRKKRKGTLYQQFPNA